MSQHLKSALWVIIAIALIAASISFLRDRFAVKPITYDLLQKNITITAEDGKVLDAVITIPVPTDSTVENWNKPFRQSPRAGVILLSPYLESGQVYGHLPAMLGRKGLVVLTVNVRYSLGPDSTAMLLPEDIARLPLDAEAAISHLENTPHVDPKRLAMLGTGLSGRAAIMAASGRKNIQGIGLVAATLDQKAVAAIGQMAQCPILVLVSLADGVAGAQAREIFEASANPASRLESYFNAGEGSDIWHAATTSEMALLIVQWMSERLAG